MSYQLKQSIWSTASETYSQQVDVAPTCTINNHQHVRIETCPGISQHIGVTATRTVNNCQHIRLLKSRTIPQHPWAILFIRVHRMLVVGSTKDGWGEQNTPTHSCILTTEKTMSKLCAIIIRGKRDRNYSRSITFWVLSVVCAHPCLPTGVELCQMPE